MRIGILKCMYVKSVAITFLSTLLFKDLFLTSVASSK